MTYLDDNKTSTFESKLKSLMGSYYSQIDFRIAYKHFGTIECILSGSLCGILFSLFSGQPLNIMSATGPVLILETIIKKLCDEYEFNFLEIRLWIGIWTFLFLLILVIFNLSFLVKYITRFTEDCFATLVAIVFIIDAVRSVMKLRKQKPKILNKITESLIINSSELNQYKIIGDLDPGLSLADAKKESVFYFSFILFAITFLMCIALKNFNKKPYLPAKFKNFLSDFSVLISILLASLLDYYMNLDTLKLRIPTEFQPTMNRSWLVPLMLKNAHFTSVLIAIVPAIIVTILIFMDQQITGVISNRKELKLKKSHGYHLDLLVVAISILFCSLFGLPWFVAATVLTLVHIDSLQIMSENTAPGERPVFIGIREQRGTNLLMSILIGLSVFLTRLLAHIPLPALYGVFMFMGVSALNGIQFVERISILFMPNKYQPDLDYLRHVNTKRVHLFTIIQVLSTGVLFIINNIDVIALTFPLLIAATTGIRKLLDYVFTQDELYWLDEVLPGNKKKLKDFNPEEKVFFIEQQRKSIHKNEFDFNKRPSILGYQSAISNSYYDIDNETNNNNNQNQNQNAFIFIDSNLNLDDSSIQTHKNLDASDSPIKLNYPETV
ncbi:unnamed protein product [Brachionus calyciflorus]|uniref:Bicarbonate transporter-like transmembrane domain-containing protein n=1 Tax=Brachionus calyciflorus TaxID=104777 RepID=A0A813NTQ7_9BILA|nr:unnamed protein product [Brachionus calyciflorus]